MGVFLISRALGARLGSAVKTHNQSLALKISHDDVLTTSLSFNAYLGAPVARPPPHDSLLGRRKSASYPPPFALRKLAVMIKRDLMNGAADTQQA